MSAENPTVHAEPFPESTRVLRLVNAPGAVMRKVNAQTATGAFSDAMDRGDPRWVFAARVQAVLHSGVDLAPEGNWRAVIDAGERTGLDVFQCRSIVRIVEDAQARGGLDTAAMRELMGVPAPEKNDEAELTDRARWMVFGMLFGWALLIAGLMQVAAQ